MDKRFTDNMLLDYGPEFDLMVHRLTLGRTLHQHDFDEALELKNNIYREAILKGEVSVPNFIDSPSLEDGLDTEDSLLKAVEKGMDIWLAYDVTSRNPNKVLGIAEISHTDMNPQSNRGEVNINDIAVMRKRCGIGSALIYTALLDQVNHSKVSADVLPGSEEFFKQIGFRHTELAKSEREKFIRGPIEHGQTLPYEAISVEGIRAVLEYRRPSLLNSKLS